MFFFCPLSNPEPEIQTTGLDLLTFALNILNYSLVTDNPPL